MNEYNIALKVEKDINLELIAFTLSLTEHIKFDFHLNSNSISHCTILKFQSNEPAKTINNKINFAIGKEFKLNLSGIKLLPSKSRGIWVEISILKSLELVNLQQALIEKLSLQSNQIINKIGDEYRPHITLGKTFDNEYITIPLLRYSLVRAKNVQSYLAATKSGKNFEILPLN